MGGFETSIVVNGPIEDVAAYLSHLENDPRWRSEWVDAESASDGILGVGTTTTLYGQLWGRRPKAVYAVTRYEPNELTEWRTVSGPLPLTFRRAFRAVDGGTQVTFSYDASPNIVLKLLEPLIIRMGKRQLAGDIPRLQAILEA